ncbi:MAG: hypothetical protein ABIC91_00510 [Nanoarchaeota archaeon]|nr:hypothetical protein [Nanoarchaeota archaeon]MBU1850590.1 hypothetical protein [Nanoarchaeota archaeon]
MWAIFIVLITIAALFYFDIISPQKYLSEQCIFSPNIYCEDFSVKKTDSNNYVLLLKLKNNLEKPIIPVQVRIYDTGNNEYLCDNDGLEIYCPYQSVGENWTTLPDPSNETLIPTKALEKWNPGMSCKLKLQGCNKETIKGSKEDITVELIFRRVSGNYNHSIKGRVYANVQ